jgi:oligopeptide transport system substrate-binding protein
VSEAIEARVRRLSRDARQAVQVAAVLGREFDFDLLNGVWNRGKGATLEALDGLLRHRFIEEGSGVLGRDYAFHHHKIQEVVYAGIPLQHRQRLHGRAGETMETLHASDLEGVAGELAYHFSQGRQTDEALVQKAVRYLLLAGDQARLAYAHQEAIDYYTQALGLQRERGEYERAARTQMKLGLVYHTHFDFPQARKAFDEGFALWQQAGRREPRVSRPPAPHPLRIRWLSPYTLDPGLYDDYVSGLVVSQLFSGLVSTGPDLEVVPELAQRWDVLEGGRRYRFHLRADARWSDGTPLTAHDLEYAWRRELDPSTGLSIAALLSIKGAQALRAEEGAHAEKLGVAALDDWTLEVELEEPDSHFLYQLTDVSTYPIPRHVVAVHGAAWTDVEAIVTSGPFALQAWDRGESMTLLRNPHYPGRRGNVEQVIFHFPPTLSPQDLSAPLEQYMQGDLDVLTLMDASVHEGDHIRRRFAAEYVSAPWLFTVYLGFVTSRPPFDDVRMRQAMALSVDRAALADVTLRGMYAPGTGGLVPRGMPGHSPNVGLRYDPHWARQLLATAGHPDGAGLPSLGALTVPPVDPLITRYLQAQWQENLGIQVTWDVLDWPPFSRRMEEHPPHLYILASFANSPDPSRYLASDAILGGTRWASPGYDELVQKAAHALDQKTRIELLRQLDRVLMQEAPVVPLIYGRQHMLVKPWVSNLAISAVNRWDLRDTVVEPH